MISIDPSQRLSELIATMLEDMEAKNASGSTIIMVPDNPDNRDRLPIVNVTIQMVHKDRLEEFAAEIMRGTISGEESQPH